MKLLLLGLCVCATAAAPQGYKPWQQSAGVAQASAQVSSPVLKTASQPSGSEVDAPILRSESDVSPEGFNYVFETGNGISAQVTGTLKKVEDIDAINVQGSFQYTAPDGTPVQVSYVADENGYQPKSDLLPVAPPVPEAIARALAYIEAHPPLQEEAVVVGRKY